MENPNIKKPDSASETSVYETAASGTPSTSTGISFTTTSSYDSALNVTASDHVKHPSNLADQTDKPVRGHSLSSNYSSNSISSSADNFPAATKKTTRDFTSSPLSSLSESSSSVNGAHGLTTTTTDVETLKSTLVLSSTETLETVLKQPSKRNVTAVTQPQFSKASISVHERKRTESPDNGRENSFTIKDSEPSDTSNFLNDNSEIEVHRKSDSSADASRTVRFSLQATEPQQQEVIDANGRTPDLLKTSKSQHAGVHADESSEEEDSIDGTNLDSGHVFVYMVVPPDGGYGWFICFISFLCQIVVDGFVYSIGILLPHIAADFNRAGSEVILIASMQIGFYFLSGTVASAFINQYGFRPVAFTGAVLAIAFLTLATFSVNLPTMILLHSILGGPALSLVWVSSQLVIGYYFERYRPIANGASCSGAGAGIMVFSFINSVLVPELGWRNLMRLHVVFLVLVLLMTLFFVEVAPTKIARLKEKNTEEDTESESLDIFYGLTNYSRFSLKVNNLEYSLDKDFEAKLEKTVAWNEKRCSCCASWLQKCCPLVKRQHELRAKEEVAKRYLIKQDPIERQDLFYSGPKDNETDNLSAEELLRSRLSTGKGWDNTKWRILSLEEIDDAFKRNTIIRNLSSRKIMPDPEAKQCRLTYAQLKVTEERPILTFLSPRNWLHPKIQKAFHLLFDFRLLDIIEFRLLLLSAFLFPMGLNIPFVYSTAFFSTLRAIIYVQALGLDKLTNAFGLTALAMGLGVFIGTTAGGILNDLTGSYTASFVFAGTCICAAGALKLLLPYFAKVSTNKGGK